MKHVHSERGIYSVTLDGEEYILPVDVDDETAEKLCEKFSYLSQAEVSDAGETAAEEGAAESDETLTCKGKDGECSREVADGEEFCWQHRSND
jgi:hypothetical protein